VGVRSILGLRHGGEKREATDSRHFARRTTDHRQRRKRRAHHLQSAILTAVTFAFPHHGAAKLKQVLSRSRAKAKANVSVTIDSFDPLPASRAYDDLIREAADAYRVDP